MQQIAGLPHPPANTVLCAKSFIDKSLIIQCLSDLLFFCTCLNLRLNILQSFVDINQISLLVEQQAEIFNSSSEKQFFCNSVELCPDVLIQPFQITSSRFALTFLLESIHDMFVWIEVTTAHSLLYMSFKHLHVHFVINHLSEVLIVCFFLKDFPNLVMWFSNSIE